MSKIASDSNMPPAELECAASMRLSEEQFYSLYDWCINPVLSLSDLFIRLREELDRCTRLRVNWQREECKINIYLFACAIACTVDDYLALPPRNLDRISGHYPFLKIPVAASQLLINSAHALPRLLFDHSILQWREEWDLFLDQICRIIVRQSEIDIEQEKSLQETLQKLFKDRLPERLLRRRMILPEGFRCQDLADLDLLEMIRQETSHKKSTCRFLIIGPRTFGAYFAPLVKAYLSVMGWPPASCMTVRPKWGIFGKEKKKLQQFVSQADHVLIVDDYPNTGETFNKMIEILGSFGVEPGRISILAPGHAVPTLSTPAEAAPCVRGFILGPDGLYKECFIKSPALMSLFQEYFTCRGWQDVTMQKNPEVDRINDQLRQHYQDGFQVRLKKVFEIKLTGNETSCVKRVFAKSVGWGWLGYHAYLAGTRLSDFVPKVIGLRNGLLFTEWIEKIHNNPEKEVTDDMLKRLSSYVIVRTEKLHLSEDPWFSFPGYRHTGWEFFLRIFRSIYSRYVVYAAMPVLIRQLKKYGSPAPTMVDGNMRPDDWIKTNAGICKVDFEHHNFGGPELDIVDPAYDLSSAIFEFQLSGEEERKLLQTYVRASGDIEVSWRIMIYKLIYGLVALEQSAYWVTRTTSDQKKEEWNRRYLWARNFLIYHMNRFCSDIIVNQITTKPSDHYFFLDIDGILDTEILGFPHTTHSGLTALRLLQSHGFSIFLNTGRSVEHVGNYCQTYGLPGGIGEYGSVLVDNVMDREFPLIDTKTAQQLKQCRMAIKEIPGVFTDNAYRYSIRAYRYKGLRTAGLGVDEIKEVLMDLQLDRLTFLSREADTYVLQKGIDKGSGLSAAKTYFGHAGEKVFAIGDSKEDIAMLEMADFAYVPSNCHDELRALACKSNWKIMREPDQKGFLAAVRDIINCLPVQLSPLKPVQASSPSSLVSLLFQLIELPRLQQLLATIRWSMLRNK